MKTVISYNRIWQVAYPIILGSIAQNLIVFTDTAFLGRVGDIALGASALGGLFYLAVVMLGFGFGTGIQIIIA
ncbi:MAG: MATE family efflux transporter, partial [Bacteroidales bacterium]